MTRLTDDGALLDIEGAARRLGTTVRQVRSLTYRRDLAFIKVGGKLRFSADDIADYIAQNRTPAAEPTTTP